MLYDPYYSVFFSLRMIAFKTKYSQTCITLTSAVPEESVCYNKLSDI